MTIENWQLKTFTSPIMVAFLMLLGYLEAGWLGLFAGVILYGIAMTTVLLALVPFAGAYFWYDGYMFFAGYLTKFIPIGNTVYIVMWVMMFIAILITIATSALVVTGVGLFLKYGKPKKKLDTGIDIIDSLIKLFPIDLFKGIDFGKLGDFFNKIIEKLTALWNKINKKLIGSAAVFLGIGIASHDFFWESEVHEFGMSRPTHGAYFGLQFAMLGMHLIVSDESFINQIKKCLVAYLGVIICYIGFFLMQFIPKGISRIINYVLWWSGIALIVYNWYIIMEPEIMRYEIAKQTKKTKKP